MSAAPVELSRREREQLEAERKKEHYKKLHAQGKTQEAQASKRRCRYPEGGGSWNDALGYYGG